MHLLSLQRVKQPICQLRDENRAALVWMCLYCTVCCMPCGVLAEVLLVSPCFLSLSGCGSVCSPLQAQCCTTNMAVVLGAGPREPPQQPCPARLHWMCPGPCAVLTLPTASDCALPAQTVSRWLHQARQTLPCQRLALEDQLKRKQIILLRYWK